MTSKVDAKFHDGIWLGLRMKSDESIIGTPSGVIKAKTARRLPEGWCAEEVLTYTRNTIQPRARCWRRPLLN